MAVTCGTPTPATTRVVQLAPGPTPHFTASAPASISASVASAVATFPAITSTLHSDLTRCTISGTAAEWPWAVSTTKTSTPAPTSAPARSPASGPTPTAAPTRSRPCESFVEFGNRLRPVGCEAQIPIRQDAEEDAALVGDRHAGDVVRRHQLERVQNERV